MGPNPVLSHARHGNGNPDRFTNLLVVPLKTASPVLFPTQRLIMPSLYHCVSTWRNFPTVSFTMFSPFCIRPDLM